MKKTNKKQRHKRKKETEGIKMGKVKQFNAPNMAIPSAEEQLVQLKANEMQLQQTKVKIQMDYAQEFASLFINIASSMAKDGKEFAIDEAKAITEKIRKATHVYVDELKEAAPEDPRFVQAKEELEAAIAGLEADLAKPEVLEEDEATGNETVVVDAEVSEANVD